MICHDVIPMDIKGKTVMSGTSQDELITIELAGQSLYYSLHQRDSEKIVLRDNQDGSLLDVEVLKVFEFSSDRKMMTVVVKINGEVLAFTKGADTSVEPRCVNLTDACKASLDHLDDMAEEGLRTLTYAYRNLPADVKAEDLTIESVEKDFTFLGVTGVEDLL